MKIIIGAVVLVVVMAGVLRYSSDTVSYVKNEVVTEVIKEEVYPEWATNEEAVKAAQDVIKRQKLEADLRAKDEEILRAEEALKELKNERKAIANELTMY